MAAKGVPVPDNADGTWTGRNPYTFPVLYNVTYVLLKYVGYGMSILSPRTVAMHNINLAS